jgi:Heavy metal associated domain 2
MVVHHLPGRLRLRLSKGAVAPDLDETVARLEGVTVSRWSARTRSLLVLYRTGAVTPDAIIQRVADAARVEPVDIPAPEPPPLERGRTALGGAIATAFSDLDARLHRRTSGVVDLGTLVPLALAAWAVRELLRGATAPLVWSSALWYAHGLFRDYVIPEPRG